MVNPALKALAANAGRGAGWLSRRLGQGGGTALPGVVAQLIYPRLLSGLAAAIPRGCVLVTGTNGKTTTTRILADALRRGGLFPITNREGSNLLRGLAATLLHHTDGWGNLRVPTNAIGVFEVDEGALLPAVAAMQPRLLVITNLFRDQLDRYFEVDYVARLWARALRRLPASATVVLNADDPQVAYLGQGLQNPVLYYGLEESRYARPALEHAADSRRCPHCRVDLAYTSSFYAHLGHYRCPECEWQRPAAAVVARKMELLGIAGSRLDLEGPDGLQNVRLPLPGVYNVYNALAAATAAHGLGINGQEVAAAVSQVSAAFGRLEKFKAGDKEVCLILVKNPSGFNEVLRLLLSDAHRKCFILALNDNIADGRDVSWIWDVDLEGCCEGVEFVIA
ncbi:MAG: MurT ligase domain-containing protein, partial [Dehalococcoidia bacterium]